MAKEPYPSDEQDKFMVRLPPGMRDTIKRHAEMHGRSMNAEVVEALRHKYESIDTLAFNVSELIKVMSSLEQLGEQLTYPDGKPKSVGEFIYWLDHYLSWLRDRPAKQGQPENP